MIYFIFVSYDRKLHKEQLLYSENLGRHSNLPFMAPLVKK